MSLVINILGKTFGYWTVIGYVGRTPEQRQHSWECRCECGTVRNVLGTTLRNGTSKSCGCKKPDSCGRPVKDISGKVFENFVVISYLGANRSRRMWQCRCVCGNEFQADGTKIRSGLVKSCGCMRAQSIGDRNRTHGESGSNGGRATPEYLAFLNARRRCEETKNPAYDDYGGRGILFKFATYEEFLEHVGRRPSPKHSLDRFPDNNGNYEHGNVRWATRKEQANNTRPRIRRKFIECPHCNQKIYGAYALRKNKSISAKQRPDIKATA